MDGSGLEGPAGDLPGARRRDRVAAHLLLFVADCGAALMPWAFC